MVAHVLRDIAQQPATLGEAFPFPRLEGLYGGFNLGIHFGVRVGRNLAHGLAGRRVHGFQHVCLLFGPVYCVTASPFVAFLGFGFGFVSADFSGGLSVNSSGKSKKLSQPSSVT